MAALADDFGPLPSMRVAASGFGAGTRDLDDRPNLTQVVLGEPGPVAADAGQPVVLLEANVDDATGEVLAHALARLLDAGAHDAWVTPIVMKKGRPAHTVAVLVDAALAAQVRAVLVAETGTLGVRGSTIERWPSRRDEGRVVIDDLSVRVKVSPGRVKAEFDDAARVAARSGRPVRDVLREAEERWRRQEPGEALRLAGAAPPEREPHGRDDPHAHEHPHDDDPHEHGHGHDHPAASGPGDGEPA
jgi:uncharacterized protein (DUF111 family)